MIANFVEWCAKNRALVLFVTLVAALGSLWCTKHVPVDALPDLTETQVILFTEYKGRSPTIVEDQVTYPLSSSLLAGPKVTAVRGYSMLGMSFVHVIFEEGTDLYWARSRVLEYASSASSKLPQGVAPMLGPDATGIGWVYEYALVDREGRLGLDELRSLQDYTIRYALESVQGVAQVASIGGFEQQLQVITDPEKLRAKNVSMDDIAQAIRKSSGEVGGRVIELSGREMYVRSRGFVQTPQDLEQSVVKVALNGQPITIGDVSTVRLGPEIRRGAADLDGNGEVVGAIVMMRVGEAPKDVVQRVKKRLDELKPGLPKGVEIVGTYDRSALIERTQITLLKALGEEGLTVALVILLFLLHFRSSLLPVISMPLAVLLAFAPMYALGIPATVMSLGGIAIAIGATVDAEIVMIEACHKRLEDKPSDLPAEERSKILASAAREVTPAIFYSLLIVAVAFLPVFGLEGQAGKLFRPLAFTKTSVMLAAALVSITVAPALRDLLLKGEIVPESKHPIARAIRAVYGPFVHIALHRPITTIAIGLFAVLSAIPVYLKLGEEFMPSLNEGDLLYMPTTLPNLSIEEAKKQLQLQDAALRTLPEVKSVFGKVGRAESPTDPAPLSMVETVIQLHPREQWPLTRKHRWYSSWAPSWLKPALYWVWPERSRETWEDIVAKLNDKAQFAGWTNAWTMPIRARVDMLTTGVRTPVGVKIFGNKLEDIDQIGEQLEALLRDVPGTRSVLYERSLGGTYVDIVPKREAIARHGLSVEDINAMVEQGIGGEPITTTLLGRRRLSIQLRWVEDSRSSIHALRNLPVTLPGADSQPNSIAKTVPLADLVDIRVVDGPPMVREEAGMLVGYVYVDLEAWSDQGGYVREAQKKVEQARTSAKITFAQGSYLRWTGQYELLAKVRDRLVILVPIVLVAISLLLYAQFRNWIEVSIVLLSVPFALVGSVWALYLLDYRLSTAVWVGVIALVGLAAQTGVVMIVYIDHAFFDRVRHGKIRVFEDIIDAHAEGTILRVRPKLMTVITMMMGLTPLLWAEGDGAEIMKRIAAPMVGGLVTSAFLTLEIIPVIYTYWRYHQLKKAQRLNVPLAEIVGLPSE